MKSWLALSVMMSVLASAQEVVETVAPVPPIPAVLPPQTTISFRFGGKVPVGPKGKAVNRRAYKITVAPECLGILRIVEERYFPDQWGLRPNGLPAEGKTKPSKVGTYVDTALLVAGKGEAAPIREAVVQASEERERQKLRDAAPRSLGEVIVVPEFGEAVDIGLVIEVELVALRDGTPSVQGKITNRRHLGWSGTDVDVAMGGKAGKARVMFPQIVEASTRFQFLYTQSDQCRVELAWPGEKPVPVDIEVWPHE
jgi:hypothetical protein